MEPVLPEVKLVVIDAWARAEFVTKAKINICMYAIYISDTLIGNSYKQ